MSWDLNLCPSGCQLDKMTWLSSWNRWALESSLLVSFLLCLHVCVSCPFKVHFAKRILLLQLVGGDSGKMQVTSEVSRACLHKRHLVRLTLSPLFLLL